MKLTKNYLSKKIKKSQITKNYLNKLFFLMEHYSLINTTLSLNAIKITLLHFINLLYLITINYN